jgi:hypothetical protein
VEYVPPKCWYLPTRRPTTTSPWELQISVTHFEGSECIVFFSFYECPNLATVPFINLKLGTAELCITDKSVAPLAVVMPWVLGLHSWLQRCLASLCSASRVPFLSVILAANFLDSAQSRCFSDQGYTNCDIQTGPRLHCTLGLVKYAFSCADNKASNDSIVSEWWKRLWPNLRYCPFICLGWLRQNLGQDNRSPGRDLNHGPPEYESTMITTRPQSVITRLN